MRLKKGARCRASDVTPWRFLKGNFLGFQGVSLLKFSSSEKHNGQIPGKDIRSDSGKGDQR